MIHFNKKIFIYLFFLTSFSANANSIYNLYNKFEFSVKDTWETSNNKDLYIPVLTWHNRYTYDQEHIDKYNEKP